MPSLTPLRTLALMSIAFRAATAAVCEVPGGTSDDGPAIKAALATCNNGGTVLLDKTYTIGSVLQTTGLSNVAIELTGTINLSPQISYWKSNGVQLTYQSAYTAWTIGGNGIHIYGGGTYHGSGDTWYSAGTTGPIPWTIYNAQNVLVENIYQTQSPFWHNFVYQSSNVTFNNINLHSIQSSGSQAQNTDGWDIYRSSDVSITNSYIINGDDCVSFKPNSTNILVENLYCQGSHGISVGSLGQYAGTQDIVENVLVKNVTMVNAENGARIKAYGGSSSSTSTSGGGNGYVTNVTFQDFTCKSVALPIVIDQCYSTSSSTCASYPSKVLINDIHYIDVTGTGSKSKEVVTLVCSDICQDITATGTNLVGTSGSSEYYCTNIGSTNLLDFPCSSGGTVVSGSSSSKTTKTSTTKTSSTKTSSTKSTTTTTTTTTTKSTTTSSTKTSSTKTSSTKTSSSTTSSASATGSLVPLYGQCGGSAYTGSTVCVAGATCTYSNPFYSQCL